MSIGTARARRLCVPPRRSLAEIPAATRERIVLGCGAGGTKGDGSCCEILLVAQLGVPTEPHLPPPHPPGHRNSHSHPSFPLTSLASSQTTRRSASRLNISLHHSLHLHQDAAPSSLLFPILMADDSTLPNMDAVALVTGTFRLSPTLPSPSLPPTPHYPFIGFCSPLTWQTSFQLRDQTRQRVSLIRIPTP